MVSLEQQLLVWAKSFKNTKIRKLYVTPLFECKAKNTTKDENDLS